MQTVTMPYATIIYCNTGTAIIMLVLSCSELVRYHATVCIEALSHSDYTGGFQDLLANEDVSFL